MLRRNRRIVASVLLAALALPGLLAAWFYFQSIHWRPSPRIWVALAALAALAVVSNVARFLRRPKAPAPKPRPTHLRIVRSEDDTLH